MTNGIGWSEQRAAIEDPEKRSAVIKASPVYRETPLEKSERVPSPLRAIPLVGQAAGSAVEAMRRFDPTRVMSGPGVSISPKQARADVVPQAVSAAPTAKKPAPTQIQTAPQVAGGAGRAIRRTTTETIRQPSPADQALSEYNRLMGKEDGGIGEAYAAQGFMKKYQALKPFDIKQEEMAGEQSRVGKELALRREELKSPTSAARERLYGAQAGVAESQLAAEQRKNALVAKLGDIEFQKKDPVGYERLQQYYKALFAPRASDASERAAYIAQGIDPDTRRPLEFGTAEGYANGGQIPAYGAAPQQNPMLAQYGQYLSAASKSGVSPVPFAKYVQLLESTRAQPEQTIGFEEGGEIPPGYAQPKDIDVGGVLRRGVQSMLRMGPKESAAAQNDVQPQIPLTDPTANFWTLDPARREEIEADVNRSRGYADGGAIDVSGKKLVGPGTGTSDSIPAVIDGSRPAALSHGEFVIPAHVVRAKGTEFFDKLIASYADKGQGDGE